MKVSSFKQKLSGYLSEHILRSWGGETGQVGVRTYVGRTGEREGRQTGGGGFGRKQSPGYARDLR